MTDPHTHDGGLAQDLPRLTRRQALSGAALAGVVGLSAYMLGSGSGHGEGTVVGTTPDGKICINYPVETAGPFPGDGTNALKGGTVNALADSGVVREDLRSSFGPLTGNADGAVLVLDIALVDIGRACIPLSGHAIYLWHADAEGKYSLYDLPDRNYLRGVVVTDANGRARVTTIIPGCYDGRWPHIHFEIFATLSAAQSGKDALLTSQFALPKAAVKSLYANDPRYASSAVNLERVSLIRDTVFGDNTAEQVRAQTVALSGSASFAGSVTVGIKV